MSANQSETCICRIEPRDPFPRLELRMKLLALPYPWSLSGQTKNTFSVFSVDATAVQLSAHSADVRFQDLIRTVILTAWSLCYIASETDQSNWQISLRDSFEQRSLAFEQKFVQIRGTRAEGQYGSTSYHGHMSTIASCTSVGWPELTWT